MEYIRVTNIKEDNDNYPVGLTVTLTRGDGKKFTVNIPNTAWGNNDWSYGLNLVFGRGCHYT